MLLKRTDLEKLERETLAPYATFADTAKREHKEIHDKYRTAFQRDRGRIIHSKSFRRLRGKTQVFVAHHGDHFRNRLSHTLEVAQISRDLARNLAVNEDLTEAIALAHDLGHTPFGHTGEERLNELMRAFGGSFEHNCQSRRMLTVLEKKYPDFEGLNMTRDLLDGLAKHQSSYDQSGEAFETQPSLEAQIVNLADEIAYTNHDLDDGLRAKIFRRADLKDLVLWQKATEKVDRKLPEEAFIHRSVSALIEILTQDLLQQTERNLQRNKINSAEAILGFSEPLAAYSPSIKKQLAELGKFLRQNFYFSQSVLEHSRRGSAILEQVFSKLMKRPELLPEDFKVRLKVDPLQIVVADFVAGMTDDYAARFPGVRGQVTGLRDHGSGVRGQK